MKIRLLTESDSTKYKSLRLEALHNNPEAFSSSYEEEKDMSIQQTEVRLNSGHSYTLGAFIEEDLVGVATLVVETKKKIQHRATIVAVYVHQDFRYEGIGKRLITELTTMAKNKPKIEQIYLTVTASNLPAKQLYTSLGFESYGIEKRALKIDDTYYDDELMVLFIK
ncbi:GNAT family N-acetyltransferase [Bacillus sp. UMB0899]|uniref:GNAT family N-acetyltransferase n=1 Tax=Metabacillus schmidteae TaxID=2730405 RepID=UPI000C8101EB|nr:GNAT family N-acetyltransferase [Metabacillus schmidteae]PMC36010.1 GNAT family N-acetyltransferase [Bacillus sp. UMB0899]